MDDAKEKRVRLFGHEIVWVETWAAPPGEIILIDIPAYLEAPRLSRARNKAIAESN